MSQVTTRHYSEQDREGFGRVRSMTYRGAEPVLPQEQLLREDCFGIVTELDGQIVGSSTVIDMTATRGEAVMRCAGLAAVGVLPEYRKTGVGSQMMEGALPLLKDAGFHLASLYPFRESYYRRFGYESCGKRFQIECPDHRMPSIKPTVPVRTISAESYELLAPCYREFSRRFAGMSIRKREQWWRTLGGETPLTIYVAGDPVEAYAVMRLAGDFWIEQDIKEFIWSTGRGYDAMLSLFSGIGINKNTVTWPEPGDSPFVARFMDKGVTARLNRQIMFRVLDVPGAIRALKSAGSGSFSLEIDDEQMPENRGPWQVSFGDGQVCVEPTGRASIRCGVRAFTQAMLGEPSFSSLVSMGLIECDSLEAKMEAETLLPAQPVFCSDLF